MCRDLLRGRQVRPVSELETARRELGLTQVEVAKRAGVSPQYIGLLEGGLRGSARVRGAVAAVLGRDVGELWPAENGGTE